MLLFRSLVVLLVAELSTASSLKSAHDEFDYSAEMDDENQFQTNIRLQCEPGQHCDKVLESSNLTVECDLNPAMSIQTAATYRKPADNIVLEDSILCGYVRFQIDKTLSSGCTCGSGDSPRVVCSVFNTTYAYGGMHFCSAQFAGNGSLERKIIPNRLEITVISSLARPSVSVSNVANNTVRFSVSPTSSEQQIRAYRSRNHWKVYSLVFIRSRDKGSIIANRSVDSVDESIVSEFAKVAVDDSVSSVKPLNYDALLSNGWSVCVFDDASCFWSLPMPRDHERERERYEFDYVYMVANNQQRHYATGSFVITIPPSPWQPEVLSETSTKILIGVSIGIAAMLLIISASVLYYKKYNLHRRMAKPVPEIDTRNNANLYDHETVTFQRYITEED